MRGHGQPAKVALTVWEGRISPVFDVCREAIVLTVERGEVTARAREPVDAANDLEKVRRLEALGVRTLICGAISEPLRREICARGVRVIGFVAGEVEEVVRAYLDERLPDPGLSMPGCCGDLRRARRRRGRRRCERKGGS